MTDDDHTTIAVTWAEHIPGLKQHITSNTVTGEIVDDAIEQRCQKRRMAPRTSTRDRLTKVSR